MRGLSKPLKCQVVGCQTDLSVISNRYCCKKRVCPAHLAAASVQIEEGGLHMRFCQQCGKYEPLILFDGNKRSCRKGLLKRRSSEKRKLPIAAAAAAGSNCKALPCIDCYQRTAYSACCSNSNCCGLSLPHEPAAVTMCCTTQFDAIGRTAKEAKKAKDAVGPQLLQQQQQQLEDELIWASQQQQQQHRDSFHCKGYDAAGIVPDLSIPHDIVSRAVDLAAELAHERQLQHQKQAAAAASAPIPPAYVLGGCIMRADSNTGSDASNESMLAAPPAAAAAAASCVVIPAADAAVPALTAAYTEQYKDNALDELLDVLYEECAAEAAAATGGLVFEDPTAAVAAALQCNTSSHSATFAASYQAPWPITPAPITPAALPALAGVAALPATQQRISVMRHQISSLQAQLMHLQQLTAAVKQQQHLQYCI